MGLFNDVAKKVGTVAGEAGTKAKDLANITKLSVSVGAKEKEIEKLYINIGKFVYENHCDSLPEDISTAIEGINSLKAEIDVLNKQIKELKN